MDDPALPQQLSVLRAQEEVRTIYHGGFLGPLIAAGVWGAAALAADAAGVGTGAAVLFFGGMLIFPLSMIGNRLLGERADLPAGHPMRGLAMQSAFGMVAGLLAAWLLASVVPGSFFPLATVVVGAHYFTFMHLYGDALFLVFGAVQVAVGLLGLVNGTPATLAAAAMAGLLLVMSASLLVRHRRRRSARLAVSSTTDR